jgi:hypothetical protein
MFSNTCISPFLIPLTAASLVICGCTAVPVPFSGTSSSGSETPAIATSPNLHATQGIAINSNKSAYVTSNAWMAGYDSNWNLLWQNNNVLSALPPSVNHLSDAAYSDNRIIAPVVNWVSCSSVKPVLLTVFNAENGSLITWSDISVNGPDGSSATVVPELNKVVVSSYCNLNHGYSTLWLYDLDTLLNNPPGSTMQPTGTISLSQPISAIQGISWNPDSKMFVVSTDTGGVAGSIWYISSDGIVLGQAYVVPGSQSMELEGVDFSTGNLYYLEGGIVTSLGAPPATPTIAALSGASTATRIVSITTPSTGSVIHFTMDGSMPTAASPVYDSPFPISAPLTIKAIAVNAAMVSSPMSVATFSIH